jgi:hypothetical protein
MIRRRRRSALTLIELLVVIQPLLPGLEHLSKIRR